MGTARPALRRFLEQARQPGRLVSTDADLQARLSRPGPQRIATVNLYELRRYVDDPVHRELVDTADGWTADGWPVVRALGAAGVRAERVTGSGLCRALLDLPSGTGPCRVAVLGSDAATLAEYGRRLAEVGRALVHADSGHRDSWTPETLRAVFDASRPDLLLIAVGTPWGMQVAARLQHVAGCPVVAIGAGVGMAVERERRAPQRAQDLRLEWAWRLARDPRRLWRRYLVDCAPLLPALRAAARDIARDEGRTA